jgi:hypothetical protein
LGNLWAVQKGNKIMNVKDMIKQFLIDNEYDGLSAESGECGCALHDLFPCGDVHSDCCAAYNKGSAEEICMRKA